MSDEYRVVPYARAHRSAVLDLHGQLLPRSRRLTERYFSWKYEQNPYLPEPTMALVFSGTDLVAMRGLIGTRWVTPADHAITIPAAEDLIIEESHRDRALFLVIDRELARIAAEMGYPSIVSLSASPTTQKLQKVTGWTRVAGFERAVRRSQNLSNPVADQQLMEKVRGKAGMIGRRVGLHLPDRVVDRLLAGITDAHIEVATKPDIRTLVTLSTPQSGTFHQEHSEHFYRWRLRNPDRRYRFVTWHDGTTRGFLVLALLPPRRVWVVDAGADDPEILGELLRALGRAERPQFTLLPDALPPAVRGAVEDLGFAPIPKGEERRSIALYERVTSRGAASPAPDVPWHAQLLDTMLA
jgi:hypothetical protein